MLNRDLFVEDPSQGDLPNDGVAKIARPESEKEWSTLEYELSHFVSDGSYESGLDRILGGYLAHLDQNEQPSVWVSGFYGSGKSHFLKVLEHLWVDTQLPSGGRARGLVRLPEHVRAHLKELDIAGKRGGGTWAASGTLGAAASGSARLALLRVVFLAAGLSDDYSAARLTMWMRSEGIEDLVRQHVESCGKELATELRHMYVSPVLAQGLMDSVPGLADSPQQLREILRQQYPNVADISNDEMLAALEDVLLLVSRKSGEIPRTLIILDELQQYAAQDSERINTVMEVTQAVQSRFGSKVLFVAAGQAALGAGEGQLRWLKDRFTVSIEFRDSDVDEVVRQVVLRKKPDSVPALREQLERVSGEVGRHLQGSRIAPVEDDAKTMVADYPVLPTRRRFWENVLRAIDLGGSHSMLRSQLRTVQEAARAVADAEVGCVVPGDFVFEQQFGAMRQNDVLTREAELTILNTDLPELARRVCATVFLVNQVQRFNPDLGLRCTGETISDLLVSDLREGSGGLRRSVEKTLEQLVQDGALTDSGGDYSLQTPESAEWVKAYRQAAVEARGEVHRVESIRSTELQKILQRHLGNLTVTQGDYRVARRGRLHSGMDAPAFQDEMIPVWVRDEWQGVSLKAAEQTAIQRGQDDAVVHLLLPKNDSQALSESIVSLAAATRTLETRPLPSTDEGRRARANIETIRVGAQARVEELLRDVVVGARILQSGGKEFTDASPKAAVEAALRAASERLYPKFAIADNPAWATVVRKAPEKGAEALQAVGWDGEPEKQPVCAAVLDYVGAGKRGAEVRQYFGAVPFGWPQDAVDGALLVLANGAVDVLRVEQNGISIKAAQVNQASLGKIDFKRQSIAVSPTTRIELRKLFQDAGLSCKSGDETAGLGQYLQLLKDLAQRAGGDAPRPALPDVALIADIRSLSGNEQLIEAWSQRAALDALRLEWQRRSGEIGSRMVRWDKLDRLSRLTQSVELVAEARQQMESIAAQRSLLDEPDATGDLLQRVTAAVRDVIRAQYERYVDARRQGVDELEAVKDFEAVPKERWRSIVDECGLGPLPELKLGSEDEILRELEVHPMGMWHDLIAGMRQRIEEARELLAKELEPETIKFVPPSRTLKSEREVDTYLADVKTELMSHIQAGKPVIISR